MGCDCYCVWVTVELVSSVYTTVYIMKSPFSKRVCKKTTFLHFSSIIFAAGSRDYLFRDRDSPGDLPAPARPRLRLQAGRGQREAQGTEPVRYHTIHPWSLGSYYTVYIHAVRDHMYYTSMEFGIVLYTSMEFILYSISLEFGIILQIHGVRDHSKHPWSSGSYYTSMEFGIVLYTSMKFGIILYSTSLEFGIILYIHGVRDHTIHQWSSGSFFFILQ